MRVGDVSEILPTITDVPPFDLVFIDAEKKGNWTYLQYLLGNDQIPSLLNPGALIITDNTLWKGRVLQELDPQRTIKDSEDMDKKTQRQEKLTKIVHEFNVNCASHPLLRTVMLPLRDGLTVSRYEPDQEARRNPSR